MKLTSIELENLKLQKENICKFMMQFKQYTKMHFIKGSGANCLRR